ncbi:O-antigen ligase family protein [Geomonas ferrireducens]|uniref:O-antigen ligase family protein n=1 Tax=Geomonas ferrireducens TaxID=2570227 RepID=UPI0013A5CF7E|nr:O-antigen ligase family protein [Geomonas ferrireducens]
MAVIAWAVFVSYFLILPELFKIKMTGAHVILLDCLTILGFILFASSRVGAIGHLPVCLTKYKNNLYCFILFIFITSLFGAVTNGFPNGFIDSFKIATQQAWPLVQMLFFLNLGVFSYRRLEMSENIFIVSISVIAIADTVLNIASLESIHYLRPLAPQSLLFIFCFLLLLERILRGNTLPAKGPLLIFVCLMTFNFMAVALSVTRTALVGLVLGSIIMFLQKFSGSYNKTKYIFFFMLFGFCFFIFFLKMGLGDAFAYRSFNLQDSERIIIWLDAFRIFKENPVIGVGPGYYINNSLIDNFDLVGGLSSENMSNSLIQIGSAHNTFLNTLATTGVIGLIFYIFILVQTRSLLSKSLQKVDWVKSYFWVTFFLSLFEESTFLPSTRYTPILLAPFWYFMGAKVFGNRTLPSASSNDKTDLSHAQC